MRRSLIVRAAALTAGTAVLAVGAPPVAAAHAAPTAPLYTVRVAAHHNAQNAYLGFYLGGGDAASAGRVAIASRGGAPTRSARPIRPSSRTGRTSWPGRPPSSSSRFGSRRYPLAAGPGMPGG